MQEPLQGLTEVISFSPQARETGVVYRCVCELRKVADWLGATQLGLGYPELSVLFSRAEAFVGKSRGSLAAPTWAAVGEVQEHRLVLRQCGPPGGSRDQGTALTFSRATLGPLDTGVAGRHLLLPSFFPHFTPEW